MSNDSMPSEIHVPDSLPANAGTMSKRSRHSIGIFFFALICVCICVIPIVLIKWWDRVEPFIPFTEYSGHAQALSSSWSPDGNFILADLIELNGSAIYTMDIDGSHIQHLTRNSFFSPPGNLVWSPDPQYILYIKYIGDGGGDIYRINADGSNSINLTNGVFYVHVFDWSPDAKRIVYTAAHMNPDNSSVLDHGIYTMDIDGSNVNQLTKTASYFDVPKWSPNGRYIAYTSVGEPDHLDQQDLYVMDADGSNVTKLTNTGGVLSFAWYPDSKKLAFSSTNSKVLDDNLYLVDVDGSNMAQLSGVPKYTSELAWSPDGAQIAFFSYNGIYAINSDGANMNLLADVVYPRSLSWSPDGKLIMYISDSSIFVMNADGSNKVQLTSPLSQ